MSEIKKITIEYIENYGGKLSKHSIAKMLHEKRPDLYASVEDARNRVRYYTGNYGGNKRLHQDRDRFFSAHPEPGLTNLFFEFPKEQANILVISDVHVPFQDKRALDIAMNYGIREGVDSIIMNGDIFDNTGFSRHEKDWNKRDHEYDFEQYQDFLFELRCAFPKAYIIYKMGNHEHWYWKWFVQNGQAKLLSVPMFQFDKVFDFHGLNIQMVEQHQTIKVGGLNIIHGHEYRGSGGVNPARWLSLRTGESTMCGHFHRVSEHAETTHSGEIKTWWSLGHLSNPNPAYLPYNGWTQGFARIRRDGEYFHVKNKRIHEGKIM
jgi:predicted phosphodiesterase